MNKKTKSLQFHLCGRWKQTHNLLVQWWENSHFLVFGGTGSDTLLTLPPSVMSFLEKFEFVNLDFDVFPFVRLACLDLGGYYRKLAFVITFPIVLTIVGALFAFVIRPAFDAYMKSKYGKKNVEYLKHLKAHEGEVLHDMLHHGLHHRSGFGICLPPRVFRELPHCMQISKKNYQYYFLLWIVCYCRNFPINGVKSKLCLYISSLELFTAFWFWTFCLIMFLFRITI